MPDTIRSPFSDDELFLLCLEQEECAEDEEFVGGLTVTVPGGFLNDIQFQFPVGTFAGTPEFTWVTGNSQQAAPFGLQIGSATGLIPTITPGPNSEHMAIGNWAVIDNAVFAPGDPVNQGIVGVSTGIISICDHLSGPFTVNERAGLTCENAISYTGIPQLQGFLGLDVNPSVNSDSTGPMAQAVGVWAGMYNYGSGNISNLNGSYSLALSGNTTCNVDGVGAAHVTADNHGTVNLFLRGVDSLSVNRGTVTGDSISVYGAASMSAGSVSGKMMGFQSKTFIGGGTVPTVAQAWLQKHAGSAPSTNNYGLYLEDQSGIGPTVSENLHSAGASSVNWFEGAIDVGKIGINTGKVIFNGTTSGAVTVTTKDAAGTWIMKLPASPGSNGQFLQTDGTGVTNWAPAGGLILLFAPVTYYIAILSGTIVGGTLYTAGTYNGVSLTGGTGTGAKANITVTAGAVTDVVVTVQGTGYLVGDVLSATAASIGGTGSGFTFTLTGIGNDSNNGTSVATPFRTLGHTYSVLAGFVWSEPGVSATINVADGIYVESLTTTPLIGSSRNQIVWNGNTSKPQNCALLPNVTVGDGVINHNGSVGNDFHGFHLDATDPGFGGFAPVVATFGAGNFINCKFSLVANDGWHIFNLETFDTGISTSTMVYDGTQDALIIMGRECHVGMNVSNTLVASNPSFGTAFVSVDTFCEFTSGATYTGWGGATGPRFVCTNQSIILTPGNESNGTYLPGNAAGTIDFTSVLNSALGSKSISGIPSTTQLPASTTDGMFKDTSGGGVYLSFNDAGNIAQTRLQIGGGFVRVTSQFDKTNDAALANITGLSVNVTAGKSYAFQATLFTTSNVAGGVQAAVGGTCTATAIIYEGETTAAAAIGAQTRATALATSVGAVTAVTAARIDIVGLITVNAAGTLTIQFAQNVSNGTASSVLVGSFFKADQVL